MRIGPTSNWQLDYSDDSCRMARTFGSGDTTTTILFERFGPSDDFTLTLVGKPFASPRLTDAAPFMINVTFEPVGGRQEVQAIPASMDELPGVIVARLKLDGSPQQTKSPTPAAQITPKFEAGVTSVKVSGLGRDDVVLPLGSMGKPMAAMRTCIDELITRWGLDPIRFAARTQDVTPSKDPRQWVRSGDYPKGAVAKGQQDVVHFRLMIGEDGSPTSCHIQNSTRPQEFDTAVCASLMKRARFKPALGAAGKPMPSYYLNFVRFQVH